MIKVFLVEDEFIVREGIKKNIDWAAHGYDFCGEAADGELALPMIQKLKPDIVITDIKIPFMDGLTLSKHIKKDFPNIEIIILSGFAEFEYAKEAIKIGVAQYLSKPISGEELLKEVDAVAKIIEEKNEERKLKELYEHEMQENTHKERRDLFANMVSGRRTVPELLEMANSMQVDLSSLWYNIVLIKLQSLNHTATEYSNSIVEAEAKIRKLSNNQNIILFDRNLEGFALLFKGDSQIELEGLEDEYFEAFGKILNSYENVRYSVGKGLPVCRISELMLSFEKASHALAHRFFDAESRIVDGACLSLENTFSQTDVTVSDIDSKVFDRKKVRDFLKYGDAAEVNYFVDEFFNSIGTKAVMSNVFRQYILIDIYFYVTEFVEGLAGDKNIIEPVDKDIETFSTVDGAIRYTRKVLTQAIELRDSAASNRYDDIVSDVVEYIEENYANDELSLNTVASAVKYSPNHLSTVFSQQTGQTFIKFLTDFRLEKAKELLKCSNMRSSEIALAVGYKDPHYFSFLFKKTLGITPTQYRNGTEADISEN